MKKQLLLIFGSVASLTGSIYAQDTAGINLTTEQMMDRYNFYNREAITQPVSSVKHYSRIEAGYKQKEGEFMLRQDAPVQKSLYFYTEGTRKTGKYRVSGSFGFSRDTKDSVAYTLKEGVHSGDPYYFYSANPGNWEINRYSLQGILSREFFNNKLTVSAGAKYHAMNAWRSNDPRTDQFDHFMKGELGLLFAPNKIHTIGLDGALLLDASENTNEYRNKDYQDNLQFIDRINFIQYGYGLSVIQTTNRTIISKAPGWKAGGLYRLVLPSVGSITLKGGHSLKKAEYFRRASTSDPVKYEYGEYEEQQTGWDGLWESAESGKDQWVVSASYNRIKGTDFHKILNGNNYVYHQESFTVRPSYLRRKDQKPMYEIWVQGKYNDLSRADGSSNHIARYKTLAVNSGVAGYWKFKPGVLKTTLSAGINKNIGDELQVPETQETVFSRDVVYHDYYYYTASVLDINAAVTYYFPVKKTTAFAGFSFGQQHAELSDKGPAALQVPGKSRTCWQFNVGIGL